MEADKKIGLTASELSQIWANYMNASLYNCILTYFNEKVEDEEIGSLINSALKLHQKQLATLTAIFENENHPVPQGFTDADVNPQAPRLYTDGYMLQNVLLLAELGMTAATMAISVSTREDIYSLYSTTHRDYNELHHQAIQVSLTKGIYIRPPSIPKHKEVDFVKKQNFLTGWFGERRPLLAPEITNLYSNIERNQLGVATVTGFSQIAQSKEVRSYLQRGIDIAKKHVNIFSEALEGSDVSVPMGSDSMVTNSSEVSPFSDKLIMFHTTGMIAQGIGAYGFSISTNIRRDIASHYTRLMGEIALYSEDGANIMIENEWLEEPPRMVDRDELAKTTSRKE
ncbi:hypothetical protein J2Z83_002576 [Virgibacillus natechei]|uniref:DUF3231 family protein n=1 Tax=Virgibacillus natechei TaxID=1216297 RepID=A0ABS4IHQ7_9BACI|nr:DUF3231 family protein [Virgibacillus natechei]MBP1970455.1 hypothetical protein [Virgibacillus natechei]UZD13896.1 DUF3231 family protein [Virgibacillus natechei]